MVNNESRKLCNKIISIAEATVEVQPGIAISVNVLIPSNARIASNEMPMRSKEKINNRLAITSINTAMAPRPCISKERKFIFDLPAYRFPRFVMTAK